MMHETRRSDSENVTRETPAPESAISGYGPVFEGLGPALRQQIKTLLQRHEPEPDHVLQVARMADLLFLGLRPWHKLDAQKRVWLHIAALLHDIGWSQTPTGSGHHKHSARMIRSIAWPGLAREEVRIVALVARYHRKSLPSARHEEYMALMPVDQKSVSILAGILRVADALDRTHTAVMTSIAVRLTPKSIVLDLHPRRPCFAELAAVEAKGDLLTLVSGRKVVLNVPSTSGRRTAK